MKDTFPEPLLEKIRRQKNIAVVVIDDAEAAVPLAKALLDGGISAIELILRTPAAGCLAHSIEGDFNFSSRTEIEALMQGDASGRMER
jgi:2-keto-3-deoxy-6-phosphogluconate aldolase